MISPKSALLMIAFLQTLYRSGLFSSVREQDLNIYQNITPACPSGELCRGKESVRTGCRCDEGCSTYEDCCRDSKYFIPSNDKPIYNFTCVTLPVAFATKQFAIKMIATCPMNASETERRRCETPSHSEPLLSLVPITVVNRTGIVYRNVFCARCNDVSGVNYHLWNTTLVCDGERNRSIFSDDAEAEWDTRINRWIYTESENKTFKCDLKVIPPDRVHMMKYRVKCPTVPYIDRCPDDWTDLRISRLCKSYTAELRLWGEIEIFKNQHCLVCNKGNMSNIRCGSLSVELIPRSGGYISRDHYRYSVLLRYVRSDCGPGEQYDPLLKECVHLFPPREVQYESNVPINTCSTVKLSKRLYIMLPDNKTVTVPKYDKNFTESHFRFSEKGELEICEKDIPVQPQTVLSLVIAIVTITGLCVSILFLVLHLCAVVFLAELRNFSGITLASLCVALLCAYVSFLLGVAFRDGPYSWCYVDAIVTYYFFMAAFFWMLILAYDVSKVLRASVKKFRAAHGLKWRRLLVYSTIAWGMPIIMAVATHCFEQAIPGYVDDFRPQFALQGCWFGNSQSLLVFFLIPLGTIMLLNFGFFLYAAAVTSENPTGQRRNLRLYVKLTIILGLTWLVGLLASALDNDIFWVIFAVLNTLQGLFIFLSFTLTSKVSKGLSKNVSCLKTGRPASREAPPQCSSSRDTSLVISSKATTSQDSKSTERNPTAVISKC